MRNFVGQVLLLGYLLVNYGECNVFNWENEFENSMFLNFGETFELYWNVINDTYIDIGISCKTLGWCGIGISPSMILYIYVYILILYIFYKYISLFE